MKDKWKIVHECDDEDGNPTVWSLLVEVTPTYRVYYWIDKLPDGTFDVIGHDCESVLKNCKSLKSAKAWVTRNIL